MTQSNERPTSAAGLPDLPAETFRSICEHIPNLVSIYDVHANRYLYVNHAVERILGYCKDEWLTHTLRFISELVHPEDRPRTLAFYREVIAKKANDKAKKSIDEPVAGMEYRIRHHDGSWVWLKTDVRVLSYKNGKVETILNESIDVTELKNTESQLRLSKMRYEAFIHNSSEGIWRFELDQPISIHLPVSEQIRRIFAYGHLAEANNAMAQMYGVSSPDDLIGMRLNQLLIEDDPQNIAYLRAFVQAGYRLSETESHEIGKNGHDKYLVNNLVGIVKNGKLWRAWGMQRDITEQRQTAIARSKSDGRLALALEATKLGIWEWDIETNNLMWSSQLKAIYGLRASEEVDYERYMSFIHPEDVDGVKQVIARALKDQKPYKIEHRVVWQDGSTHWVLSHGQAIKIEGKAALMIGSCLTIDDRKAAEELQLHAALLSKERQELLELNAAKDEFIAVASHQLRTPATGVKQYIGMLLEGYYGSITNDQMASLQKAYASNERQIKIINDLLIVASIDAGKVHLDKSMCDLTQLVRDIADEQRSDIQQRGQQLILNAPKKLPARIDKRYIRMVIENLISNASKYSADDKPIVITVKTQGANAIVSVSDKGVGISKADQKKLYQKFSRIYNERSNMVEGTGLGLYWAKKIIELHNGTLQIESKLHHGSTFSMLLPL